MNIAVLMRTPAGEPRPPSDLPIGRAALTLAARGVTVVFGQHAAHGTFTGLAAHADGWVPTTGRVHAALDRYGSFTDPDGYHALLAGLGSTPVFNPPRLTALLRDKLATQVVLGDLGMPELVVDPTQFGATLEQWNEGFLKPRFGSFGRGVQVATTGCARAVVDGVDQPLILQRGVAAPPSFAGVSLRILVQWSTQGPLVHAPVARVSRTDRVVNRARGADVFPADDLFPTTADRARELAHAVFLRLDGLFPGLVEIGVDAVVAPDGEPVLIEVNARPRGRLAALASSAPDRFQAAHERAVLQPLLALMEI